jgi:Calcineurin-like phosphoesterase
VDDPAAWDAQINGVLGENFPYFATMGNHDESRWDGPEGYQQFLMNRLRRAGIAWNGDLGVQSSLRYEGIFLLLTAPGVRDTPKTTHQAYIREQLAADRSTWSISAWHKNMERMQAGGKDNDTGWGVYEESANGGAVIVTGHEHSYSRSHLLTSISKQTVASTSDVLTLTKGQSFVVVTGLGGESIRRQRTSGTWWARVYASRCLRNDQACQPDAAYGAFFGVFNVDGTPNKASFYFKDVNGKVVDRFTVFSRVESVTQTTQN